MDPLHYWHLKIYQLLHDPPNKPFHLAPRGDGAKRLWIKHDRFAQKLFHLFTESRFKGFARADLAATGADRPVVAASSRNRQKGAQLPQMLYNDKDNRWILHPLAPKALIRLPHADDQFSKKQDTVLVPPEDVKDDDDLNVRVMAALRDIVLPEWNEERKVREAAVVIWRRLRDELMTLSVGERSESSSKKSYQFDVLWEYMPAETRSPDHSIWDHTRMAAALAFLDVASDVPQAPHHDIPAEMEPWLLQVSIFPVGEFIEQSRKAQDLWISSFLIADLSWHAMLPIVERYGPENIISPDLRGNPRVDYWLKGAHEDALPEFIEDPSSFAALLPNTFVAVVPRGGDGRHLEHVHLLAKQCCEAVDNRWKELASTVLQWLLSQAREESSFTPAREQSLKNIWEDQHKSVIRTRWTAVPWMLPERLSAPIDRLGKPSTQDLTRILLIKSKNQKADDERASRLQPWVPVEIWKHYETARGVFARVDLGFLQGERGFDYALTHHQLRIRHAIRKQTAVASPIPEQPGEKCTLCGQRTALGDFGLAEGRRAPIEARRQQVRKFWSHKWLDPEQSGAERLCAVCTFKRFLVEADGVRDDAKINRTWAGRNVTPEDLREGPKARVPFPSTSAIAAQSFLARIVMDPSLQDHIKRVVEAHDDAIGEKVQFPRALPQLAAAATNDRCSRAGRQLLELEPQEILFPRTLDARIARAWKERDSFKHDHLLKLQRAVIELLKATRAAKTEPGDEKADSWGQEPGTRFAVIQVDGDSIGKLLLGDPERIATTWADVIHPEHIKRMKNNSALVEAGWLSLLEHKRLIGPSLHAFISRALAEFAHRIVPWVVEREHAGRLVYAGGDDVLALAPAGEALSIAARLQELFSAAWVIDTDYTIDTWAWRRPNAHVEFDRTKARNRFHIQSTNTPDLEAPGPLLAMLGPGVSLSAGITIGHFKAPLRGMLHQAHDLLNRVAKAHEGRSAVAFSYYTRSGPKYQFGTKWILTSMTGQAAMPAKTAIEMVVNAFRDRSLPSRLPYKLREAADSVHGALQGGAKEDELLRGLLHRALDGKALKPDVEQAVLSLWRAGIQEKQAYHGMLDGLLLARAIASGEPEDEE